MTFARTRTRMAAMERRRAPGITGRLLRGLTPTLFAGLLLAPAPAEGQPTPADGTVYVRLIGNVRALRGDDPRLRRDVLLGLSDIPVATGTGFIISPDGWVVTNLHVVTGETRVVTVAGEKVEIAVDVQRIEVVVPGHPGDPTPRRYEASITASDTDLDLAVLYISGQQLPYVALGDSDAIATGEPVRALGYPFGDALELARPDAVSSALPDVSVSPGAVSSLRRDPAGEVRYVQTTAPLNPGNSGGPIVDEDGFVVAVAQLEVTDGKGRGIGFGIPVNVLKLLLRRHGLDQRLPARLLGLGTALEAASKGVRLPVPAGFVDHSPMRVRVDSSVSDPAVTLRIDRVASTRSLDQLERTYLNDQPLDRVRVSGNPRRRSRAGGTRAIEGSARAVDTDSGQEIAIVYAMYEVGGERLIARYLGSPEAIATNRSILQASLSAIEWRPLLTGELTRYTRPTWAAVMTGPNGPPIVAPDGWVTEPGEPSPCAGLGPPAFGVTTSPAGDYTVQLRAAWRPGLTIDTAQAARVCAPGAGRSGAGSYASAADWWGAAYQVEGVFLAASGGVWHLEVIAPAAKRNVAASVFDAWTSTFVKP